MVETNKKPYGPRYRAGVVLQFLDDNRSTKVLADKINDIFLSITENFPSLSPSRPIQHVPHEFLVCAAEVYRSFSSIQVAKSVGPD